MAHITLSGTLLDPNGDNAVGDKIRFTHKSTTGETVQSAVSVLTIPPNGTYSINLEYGLVLVEYKDVTSAQFKNRGVATVNGTNPATSIPELLNAVVPVSSAELIEFQAILADCVTAQTAAETAAAEAAASAAVVLIPVSEVITLVDGQTLVTFATLTTDNAEFNINGSGIDGRVLSGQDYNLGLTTTTTITLFDSYPAGSIVTLSKNTSASVPEVDRDYVHNEPTLNAAIIAIDLVAGDAVNLAERTTGNGGGAMWDVVLSSSVTENGYNIVQCTGVPTLSLVLRIEGAVNVRQFGAVGDGVTDDTLAIQSTLDFVTEDNATSAVYMPTSNYVVTSRLTLTDGSNKIIYGDGPLSIITSTVQGDTTLLIKRGKLTSLENFSVLGNNLSGPSGNGHAIRFLGETINTTDYPQSCRVDNLTLRNFKGGDIDYQSNIAEACGIYMSQGLACYVDSCDITGNGDGVRFDDMEQSYIKDSIIFDHKRNGVTAFSCEEGLHITGCDIIGNATTISGYSVGGTTGLVSGDISATAIELLNISNSKFKDTQRAIWGFANKTTNITGNSIKPYVGLNGVELKTCGNVNIENNRILYVDTGTGVANYGGIKLDSDSTAQQFNYRVSGNEFSLTDAVSVCLHITNDEALTQATTIEVVNNNFNNTGRSAGTVAQCILLDSDLFKGNIDNNIFYAEAGQVITTPITEGTNFVDGGISYHNNTYRENGGTITNQPSLPFVQKGTAIITSQAYDEPASNKIISAGAVDYTTTVLPLNGEGGVADDLDTINGGFSGAVVILRAGSGLQQITIKNGTGNIFLKNGTDFTLANARLAISLCYLAGFWSEI